MKRKLSFAKTLNKKPMGQQQTTRTFNALGIGFGIGNLTELKIHTDPIRDAVCCGNNKNARL